MSNTSTINRGGDRLSLTAQRGGAVLVSLHSVNPAAHLTGLSVPADALRTAVDDVAPSGSYTRHESPDYADGGITAALIEKEAEQHDPSVDYQAMWWKAEREREKAEQERDHLATVLATTARQRDEVDKRNAHPLTPDAITDEMVQRLHAALVASPGWTVGPLYEEFPTLRNALTAALTPPPARPEGVEELDELIGEYLDSTPGVDDKGMADFLAERGVRVVSEEQP